jgi:broad specificity phosphatase PhoE
MEDVLKLFMVRHGETIENSKEIIQGHTLGSLSEKGKQQAVAVAHRLKSERFDCIYVSDLKRAVDTSKQILRFHNGVQVFYDQRIREQNLGIYEGSSIASLREEIKKKETDFVQFVPPEGESVEDLSRRSSDFYRSILEKHSNEAILLITHGGVIITMLLYIFKWDFSRYREVLPENTAVTIIEINSKGTPKLLQLNSVEHLK